MLHARRQTGKTSALIVLRDTARSGDVEKRMVRLWHVQAQALRRFGGQAGGLQRPDGHAASVAFNLLAEALAPIALPG